MIKMLHDATGKEIVVRFHIWDCNIQVERYNNDRIALQLISAVENEEIAQGEPIAMATVNIPTVPLADDEVIIKNYSENEGIEQVLIDAGIIEPTGKIVAGGFVQMNICKLKVMP